MPQLDHQRIQNKCSSSTVPDGGVNSWLLEPWCHLQDIFSKRPPIHLAKKWISPSLKKVILPSFAKSAIEWRTFSRFSSAVYFNKLSFSDTSIIIPRVHRPRSPRSPRHIVELRPESHPVEESHDNWPIQSEKQGDQCESIRDCTEIQQNIHMSNPVQRSELSWGFSPSHWSVIQDSARASGQTPELYRRHPAARGVPLEGVKQSKIITFSKRVRWPHHSPKQPNSCSQSSSNTNSPIIYIIVYILLIHIYICIYIYIYYICICIYTYVYMGGKHQLYHVTMSSQVVKETILTESFALDGQSAKVTDRWSVWMEVGKAILVGWS